MSEVAPLPYGWQLTPTPQLRTFNRWSTLLSWSPSTMLRLTNQGALAAKRILAGEPLTESASERLLARRLERAGMATADPPDDSPPLRCSVVIPSYNDSAEVERTIAALGPPVCGADYEIVVVDDGGSPALTLDQSEVTTIRLTNNRGPSAARNAGAQVATAAVIVFIDAGVEISSPALVRLVSYLNDSETVAVAPRIESSGASRGRIAAYEKLSSPLDLGDRPAIVQSRSSVAYVPSTCLAVDSAVFQSLGGFDEQLRFGEDVDLVWRMTSRGVVRYVSGVKAVHQPRKSIAAFVRQRHSYGTSAADLAARHPDAFVPLVVEKWGTVSLLLLLAGHPLLAAVPLAYRSKALADTLPKDLTSRSALAVSLVGRGQLALMRGMVESLLRPYGPLTLLALTMKRSLWGPVVLGVALRAKRHFGSPIGIALSVIDDLAYTAGVWQGAIKHRSIRCLIPKGL